MSNAITSFIIYGLQIDVSPITKIKSKNSFIIL